MVNLIFYLFANKGIFNVKHIYIGIESWSSFRFIFFHWIWNFCKKLKWSATRPSFICCSRNFSNRTFHLHQPANILNVGILHSSENISRTEWITGFFGGSSGIQKMTINSTHIMIYSMRSSFSLVWSCLLFLTK